MITLLRFLNKDNWLWWWLVRVEGMEPMLKTQTALMNTTVDIPQYKPSYRCAKDTSEHECDDEIGARHCVEHVKRQCTQHK
jgi:hypothetical protein